MRVLLFSCLMVLCFCELRGDTEPNNSFPSGNSISFNSLHYGTLSSADYNDYYVLTLSGNGRIRVSLDCFGGPLTARIFLLDADGSSIGASLFTSDSTSFLTDCIATGAVGILVNRNSGAGGYAIKVEETINPGGSDPEPNNSIATAIPISVGTPETGMLGYRNGSAVALDQEDVYQLVLNNPSRLVSTVDFSNILAGRLYVYGKDGTLMGSSGASSTNIMYNINCLSADTVYLHVGRTSGCGSYTLQVDVEETTTIGDVEPNNTIGTSSPAISSNFGTLGYQNGMEVDDVDWYYLNLSRSGQIDLSAASADGGVDFLLTLLDSDGNTLLTSPAIADSFSVSLSCYAADTYTIGISRLAGCGTYELQCTLVQSTQPNDSETAAVLNEATSQSGNLGYNTTPGTDLSDIYTIDLQGDGKINLDLQVFDGLHAEMVLMSKDMTPLETGTTTSTLAYTVKCLAADTYYVQVNSIANCGSYLLSYTEAKLSSPNDNEPNNSISAPISLNFESPNEGHLGYFQGALLDRDDYYVFELSDPTWLSVRATFGASLVGRLSLVDSLNNTLATSTATSDTADLQAALDAGTKYWLVVQHQSGCGNYLLEQTNECSTPANVSTDLVISVGAKLVWDTVSSANAYRVQTRLAGTSSWTEAVTGADRFSFYPLDACETYEYRVRAECGANQSSFSPTQTFTTLCEPYCPNPGPINVGTVTSNSANLSWQGQPWEWGYRLQYVEKGGTGISTVYSYLPSISITGLNSGSKYLYRVTSLCLDNGISGYSIDSFNTAASRMALVESEIEVFPNPAKDILSVRGVGPDQVAALTDLLGRNWMAKTGGEAVIIYDVSDLPSGTYFVVISRTLDSPNGSPAEKAGQLRTIPVLIE